MNYKELQRNDSIIDFSLGLEMTCLIFSVNKMQARTLALLFSEAMGTVRANSDIFELYGLPEASRKKRGF